MELSELKVMRGPNQWSLNETNLIVLKIYSPEISTEQLTAVSKQASSLFKAPQYKSAEYPDASLYLLQLVKHITQYLLTEAGMSVSFSSVRTGKKPNEHFLIYAYENEKAASYAGESAVAVVHHLIQNKQTDLTALLEETKRLKKKYSIGPTTTYLLNEVKKRGIPFKQFNYGSLITLGHGSRQKKIRTAVTDLTSGLGIETAGDKEETKMILEDANVPIPKGIVVYSEEELRERLHEVRFPVVVKPLDGNHGRGVTTDISNLEKALFGFAIAQKISRPVIVEEFIQGDDYRFLVINYKLVAAALRMPAYVTGDETSTIQQLIDEENKDAQRGDGAEHVLAKIRVDAVTEKIFREKKLDLNSVLPKGERLILKDTANISAGGTATDVTDLVHPDNKFMVERIARIFNLDICGIDIMASTVSEPISREVGAVIEVNAGPGLRMHSNPQKGVERNVAAPIIDMLFDKPQNANIPIVAITGTNGKTTTSRLVSFIASQAGYKTGLCTTEGIFIDGHNTYEGDCTGFISAQQVLFDPWIDYAVLECARGGIIRSGLGFKNCDVSIVTNISEDHLGLKDIHTLDDLLNVKAVVPRSTKKDGYAILNANDNKVYSLYDTLDCKIALFSMDGNNERIREHIKKNGMAAFIEGGQLIIVDGHRIHVDTVDAIPLTFNGKAEFMIRNVMAAVLAAHVSGIDTSVIRQALRAFHPNPQLNPGRMNLFNFDQFRVMVDYAHNVDGFTEIKKFLSHYPDQPKTGIIAVAGDRRDEDIRSVGMIAAATFNRIIIRHDKNPREKSGREIETLLTEGILRINGKIPVDVIPDEREAIQTAIASATPGSFIFICADKIKETLEFVAELQKENLSLTTKEQHA